MTDSPYEENNKFDRERGKFIGRKWLEYWEKIPNLAIQDPVLFARQKRRIRINILDAVSSIVSLALMDSGVKDGNVFFQAVEEYDDHDDYLFQIWRTSVRTVKLDNRVYDSRVKILNALRKEVNLT